MPWDIIIAAGTAIAAIGLKWWRDRRKDEQGELDRWMRLGIALLSHLGDSDVLPGNADRIVDKVLDMLRQSELAPDPDKLTDKQRQQARDEAESVAQMQSNVIAKRMLPFALGGIAREAREVQDLIDKYERVSARL